MPLEIYKFARIGELKSAKISSKQLLQKVFMLLKINGYTDINCMKFVS